MPSKYGFRTPEEEEIEQRQQEITRKEREEASMWQALQKCVDEASSIDPLIRDILEDYASVIKVAATISYIPPDIDRWNPSWIFKSEGLRIEITLNKRPLGRCLDISADTSATNDVIKIGRVLTANTGLPALRYIPGHSYTTVRNQMGGSTTSTHYTGDYWQKIE